MRSPPRTLPLHRLPPGLDEGSHPRGAAARPRPAATLILLREGRAGLQTLLLKRSSRTPFLPGTFVFPGGRVEDGDGDPALLSLVTGTLRSPSGEEPPPGAGAGEDPEPASPAHAAFAVAALRETFEETGILLSPPPLGCHTIPVFGAPAGRTPRDALLSGKCTFIEVLEEYGAKLDVTGLSYIANWLTPESEPRRYDTRFFAARVPEFCKAIPDGREMVQALWVPAEEALRRNEEGNMPLAFPTLRTLEVMASFRDAETYLSHTSSRAVPRLLPTLLRRPGAFEIAVRELRRHAP